MEERTNFLQRHMIDFTVFTTHQVYVSETHLSNRFALVHAGINFGTTVPLELQTLCIEDEILFSIVMLIRQAVFSGYSRQTLGKRLLIQVSILLFYNFGLLYSFEEKSRLKVVSFVDRQS